MKGRRHLETYKKSGSCNLGLVPYLKDDAKCTFILKIPKPDEVTDKSRFFYKPSWFLVIPSALKYVL